MSDDSLPSPDRSVPAAGAIQARWQDLATHRRMLEEYVRCLVGEGAEADDVFQEVGLVVLQHPTGPDDPGKFAPWCRSIARNLVFARWRRHKRRERLGQELLALIDRAYEEQDADAELWTERRHALGGCLEQLGAADRMLLRLRYVEERTSEAIASAMNSRADAIRVRLRRVREVLSRCIQRQVRGTEA